MWGEGTGNKKHNRQAQNRQGEVKNSIGNGEAKEFTCITHGHDLRGLECSWAGWGCRTEVNNREKKWDNYNSTISKIYF